jgi:hypothetical protein
MLKKILILLLLTNFTKVIADQSSESDITPPPTDYSYDSTVDEPEIIIKEENDEVIEEYRMNGNLYMIKVTPKNSSPYYLIKDGPNAEWVKKEDGTVAVPMWVIGTF